MTRLSDEKQTPKLDPKLYSALILAAAYVFIYVIVFFSYALNKTAVPEHSRWTYAAVLILLCISTLYFMLTGDGEKPSVRKSGALAATMVTGATLLIVFSHMLKLTFLAPYALCGLVISVLIDAKQGFFANFCVVMAFFAAQLLFGGVSDLELYYPLFGGVFSGVIAAYLTNKNTWRLRYIAVGLGLSLFTLFSTAVIYFMFGDFSSPSVFLDLSTAFISGVLCIMLMFFMVPVLERVFRLTTNFRLAEITSTSHPLLRRLFEEAPGTFNHSLTVANYAEACAAAIGVSTFMARAAAYYHDVGKLKNPNYFVENQSGGANPHDELTPEASVIAIKKHVAYGLTLARENHLPPEVESAIAEHHGTMPIKFFYLKAKKYTDGDLPYDDYRYDGPTPASKINGILMIVDACEAALRAKTREDPAKIVAGIVTERMEFNQFADCELTMRDIDVIKSTILSTYMGIRHDRIKYPKAKLTNTENK